MELKDIFDDAVTTAREIYRRGKTPSPTLLLPTMNLEFKLDGSDDPMAEATKLVRTLDPEIYVFYSEVWAVKRDEESSRNDVRGAIAQREDKFELLAIIVCKRDGRHIIDCFRIDHTRGDIIPLFPPTDERDSEEERSLMIRLPLKWSREGGGP